MVFLVLLLRPNSEKRWDSKASVLIEYKMFMEDEMNKIAIHLFGPSGAGTSTIGRYIANQINAYYMDTDDYFWLPTDPPYTAKRSVSDRISLLQKDILAHDRVVLAGSLVDWGDALIPRFTLAVRVETDTAIRLKRLKARERARFGNRIDPGGDMYEIHQRFIDWAAAYDESGVEMRSKAKHNRWQTLLECPVVMVDGSLPIEHNWQIIKQYLYNSGSTQKALD